LLRVISGSRATGGWSGIVGGEPSRGRVRRARYCFCQTLTSYTGPPATARDAGCTAELSRLDMVSEMFGSLREPCREKCWYPPSSIFQNAYPFACERSHSTGGLPRHGGTVMIGARHWSESPARVRSRASLSDDVSLARRKAGRSSHLGHWFLRFRWAPSILAAGFRILGPRCTRTAFTQPPPLRYSVWGVAAAGTDHDTSDVGLVGAARRCPCWRGLAAIAGSAASRSGASSCTDAAPHRRNP